MRRQFSSRRLCRECPLRAPATCPLLPLLCTAVASTKIGPSLHSLRRLSTFRMSPLPRAPAICLSLPLLCMAITSVAVCPSLPLPRVGITRPRRTNYLPAIALAARAIDHPTRWRRSLVTSCRPHSCSYCQLLNPFLAYCHFTSCCAAALHHLSSCRLLMRTSLTPPPLFAPTGFSES